jgi:flagellar hook protein FlgE
MALLGALQTGASGVKTYGKAMQVTGNNISNVNTFGFKRNIIAFEDLLGNDYPARPLVHQSQQRGEDW